MKIRLACALTFLLAATLLPADTPADFAIRGPVLELEETSFSGSADGQRLSGRKLVFNPAGRLVTEYWSGPEGTYSTVIQYTYDEAGRAATRSFTQAKGATPDITVYRYDDAGRLSELEHTFTVGTYGWIYRFTYDDAGRLAEKAKFSLKGTPESVLRYRYDAEGRVIEEGLYTPRGALLSKTVYLYADGWTEREIYPDGKTLASRRRREYNHRGDPVRDYTDLAVGGRLWTRSFTYRYDEYGNWTERVEEYSGSEAYTVVTRRRILYSDSGKDVE